MKIGPILFMSPGCGACKEQKKILDNHFRSKGQSATVNYINVDNYPNDFSFVTVTPTWAFPQGKENYKLYRGIIEDPRMIESVSSFGGKRSNRFGKELYESINNLDYYGKNFPNGKGFNLPESFHSSIENKWGKGDNALNAGVGGTRSLGPDKISDIYTNNYVNNIRMAHPSDQLGTALYLNRTCNNPSNKGMISDASNPQIVDNTTGFGRRSKFGSLYKQMGPASEIGNQYLINKDTGKQLYSGAQQYEYPRPRGVSNGTYISTAKLYNPLHSFGKNKTLNVSGKKAVNIKINIKQNNKAGKPKKFIGEGSTLKLSKNNKVKVKN